MTKKFGHEHNLEAGKITSQLLFCFASIIARSVLMAREKPKFFYHITIHRCGSMKTRYIETTSRVIEHHRYRMSRIAKFYKS